MGISLIATDLDGTLLDAAAELTPATKAAVAAARRQGVRVVIATTRNLDIVRGYCHQLGIDDEPVICSNGAHVLSAPHGETWSCRVIPREIGLEIARLADAENWDLNITVGEQVYLRRPPGPGADPVTPGVTILSNNEAGVQGDVLRIFTWQPESVAVLSELCATRWPDVCYTEPYFNRDGAVYAMGIFARGADKGTALATVLERLAIPPERVMAIGDNQNDVPLFAHAGIRVAVGNAIAALKQEATLIAPDHRDDGAAWAIRKILESV